MDLFVYRTYGEIGYVDRVNGISAALLESWRGRFDVEDAAYLLGCLLYTSDAADD